MKFENTINYIAAKFITQAASFKDLQNLHKPEYCNKISYINIKGYYKNI